MSNQPPQPEPPPELWMLWSPTMGWVPTDDWPDDRSLVVALNAESAQACADAENREYDLDCYPVKVKP